MASLPEAPPVDVERFFALTSGWRERAELIDGEVVVVPAPSYYHQEVATAIVEALRAWTRTPTGAGRALISPIDVKLGDQALVQPDVAWWREDIDLHVSPGPPPDLAVEVLSPASRRRDVETKRRLYARAGIAEMWLVDPDTRSITTLRDPREDDYAAIAAVAGDGSVTSPLLPGLSLPVAPLFPA